MKQLSSVLVTNQTYNNRDEHKTNQTSIKYKKNKHNPGTWFNRLLQETGQIYSNKKRLLTNAR